MSKLAVVRAALAGNKDVVVVDTREGNRLPDTNGWVHTVDIFTAPEYGLYTADALEAFMMGLVNLEPTQMDRFRDGPGWLQFGKLYFDEPIGTAVTMGSRVLTVTDPDVELPEGFVDGRRIFSLDRRENLMRRTWVRVYPDTEYAARAFDGTDEYEIRDFQPPRRVSRRRR